MKIMIEISKEIKEKFLELLNLKITIAEDPDLMEIDKIAMEAAVDSLKNKLYKIKKKYKMAGHDRSEE